MDEPIKYIRAGSLVFSEKYLCRISPGSDGNREYTTVAFVGYTTCPAIVVVQDSNMVRFRCDRMNLFVPSQNQ